MIESILSLFIVGTIGFWVLMAAVAIIIIASIENDHFGFPALLLMVVGAIYHKELLLLGWTPLLLFALCYLVIGIAWSAFKWYRYVKKQVRLAKSRKSFTEAMHENLKDTLSLSNNKSRITAWLAYWPFSLIWSLTGDFWNMIFENVKALYQRILDNALEG